MHLNVRQECVLLVDISPPRNTHIQDTGYNLTYLSIHDFNDILTINPGRLLWTFEMTTSVPSLSTNDRWLDHGMNRKRGSGNGKRIKEKIFRTRPLFQSVGLEKDGDGNSERNGKKFRNSGTSTGDTIGGRIHWHGMRGGNNDRGTCDGDGGFVVDWRSRVFAAGRTPDSVVRETDQRKSYTWCWWGERAWELWGWEIKCKHPGEVQYVGLELCWLTP